MKGRITKTFRAEVLPFHATIMPKGKCFGGQRLVELYYCIWILFSFVYLKDLQWESRELMKNSLIQMICIKMKVNSAVHQSGSARMKEQSKPKQLVDFVV